MQSRALSASPSAGLASVPAARSHSRHTLRSMSREWPTSPHVTATLSTLTTPVHELGQGVLSGLSTTGLGLALPDSFAAPPASLRRNQSLALSSATRPRHTTWGAKNRAFHESGSFSPLSGMRSAAYTSVPPQASGGVACGRDSVASAQSRCSSSDDEGSGHWGDNAVHMSPDLGQTLEGGTARGTTQRFAAWWTCRQAAAQRHKPRRQSPPPSPPQPIPDAQTMQRTARVLQRAGASPCVSVSPSLVQRARAIRDADVPSSTRSPATSPPSPASPAKARAERRKAAVAAARAGPPQRRSPRPTPLPRGCEPYLPRSEVAEGPVVTRHAAGRGLFSHPTVALHVQQALDGGAGQLSEALPPPDPPVQETAAPRPTLRSTIAAEQYLSGESPLRRALAVAAASREQSPAPLAAPASVTAAEYAQRKREWAEAEAARAAFWASGGLRTTGGRLLRPTATEDGEQEQPESTVPVEAEGALSAVLRVHPRPTSPTGLRDRAAWRESGVSALAGQGSGQQ